MAKTKNSTDKQVQDLFKVVQQKKREIQKIEKSSWQTNCSFSFTSRNPIASDRVNLQVVTDLSSLVEIYGFLKHEKKNFDDAANELGISVKFVWLGYSFEDWQADIQTRISKIQINKKKTELDTLESRLNSLISPELRAQMELDEIQNILNSGD